MSKPKTDDLPGVEGPGVSRPKIKPLDEAIDRWTVAKEKRMLLTEKEVEAKGAVRDLMKKHEVQVYRYDEGHEVVLAETVKVRKVDVDGEGEGDEF